MDAVISKAQELEAVLAMLSGSTGVEELTDDQIAASLRACHCLAVDVLALVERVSD